MKRKPAEIHINFSRRTLERDILSTSFSTYILLFLGLVFCTFSLHALYQQVSLRNAGQLTQQKYSLNLQGLKKESAMYEKPTLTQDEMHASNQLIERLNFPWSDFFDALEDAETANISLISIDANSDKNTVSLILDARDQDAIFQYIKNIKKSESFDRVRLIQTEHHYLNEKKPFKFHLELEWQR